ncbi:MAG: MFS transporter [Candidatus Hodarchaeota archaeon]
MSNEVEAKEWIGYHTYLVIFLSIVNFFTIFSVVYGGLTMNNVAKSFGISVTIIPLITSIMGIGMVFSIIFQNQADRFGRKKVMFVFYMLIHINGIFYILSPNIIIYTILGFIGSTFGVNLINVIISEEIPARYRGTIIGIVQGIGMSGSILAAFLSTFLGYSPDMWRYIYLSVDIPGTIIFAILWLWMKEPKRFQKEKEIKLTKEKSRSGIFAIFQPKYIRIFSLSCSLVFSVSFIYITIKRYFKPFLLDERGYLGFNDATVGFWMIFIYLGSIIGYYLSGYLADKIGRRKTIYISAFIYFIFNITFVIIQTDWVILLSLLGINTSFSIFFIATNIYAVEFFSTEERATGLGWITIIGNSPWVFGNLIISILLGLGLSWGSIFLLFSFLPILLIILTKLMPETKELVLEDIHEKYVEKK